MQWVSTTLLLLLFIMLLMQDVVAVKDAPYVIQGGTEADNVILTLGRRLSTDIFIRVSRNFEIYFF